ERHIGAPVARIGIASRLAVEHKDLGNTGHARPDGMKMQLAETRGEIALLKWREILVLEKEHFVVEQGLAKLGDDRFAEWPGKVQSRYLRAQRGRHGRDIER